MTARPRWRPEGAEALRVREQYVALLPPLRAAARALGYALAVHGSMVRDLDLVAVPWNGYADAVPAERLIETLRVEAGGLILRCEECGSGPMRCADERKHNPVERAHGRLAWSIHLGGGPYLDIGVMPRRVS